jgi:hypothetical protein
MKPSTRIGADPTFCKLCGDRYWSWGAHAERCVGRPDFRCPCGHAMSCHGPEGCEVEISDYGVLDCSCTRSGRPTLSERVTTRGRVDSHTASPRSESVEQPCECPPGFQHQPDCHIVTGPAPKGKPNPDYNPRVDYPERYMSDDVWSV